MTVLKEFKTLPSVWALLVSPIAPIHSSFPSDVLDVVPVTALVPMPVALAV